VTVEQLRGAAAWNKNDREDDLFVSFAGRQRIQLRDRWIDLEDGEAVVIPKGIEYRPVAREAVEILSF
jgi:mannose-6-phosphate isomerase-like protein (cupin superfamily)